MSDKVMEILNQDEKAKRLNTKFNKLAEQKGLTGEQYQEARKTFLMLMIAGNPQAMDEMAGQVYDEINQ